MITQNTIQTIHELPIISVAEKFGLSLKKQGVNQATQCLWHADKKPSLTFSSRLNVAKCFVCGETANTIKLVRKIKDLDYANAIREIAKAFNVKIEETDTSKFTEEEKSAYKEQESLFIANSFAAEYYHTNLLVAYDNKPRFAFASMNFFATEALKNKMPELKNTFIFPTMKVGFESSETPLAYIRRRFTLEEVKRYKLGYAFRGYTNFRDYALKNAFKRDILLKAGLLKITTVGGVEHLNDNFVNRPLIIPILQKSKIVGFGARQFPDNKDFPKYLNTSDTDIYKKSDVLFGLTSKTIQEIKNLKKVYVVEGYTDVMQLNRIGIENVVAKSGTSFTKEQMQILKNLTDNIILLDDGDKAGQAAMLKYGKELCLLGFNVTAIKLPATEDPGSFFKNLAQFKEFEQTNTSDYIIDVAAQPLSLPALSITEKKETKQYVADLLLSKNKDLRTEFLPLLAKKTGVKASDWSIELKAAAIRNRQKGINTVEENSSKEIEFDNSDENRKNHNFYEVVKDAKGNFKNLKINRRTFLERLKSFKPFVFKRGEKEITIRFGFYSYKFDESDERIYVQLRNGRIRKVEIDDIKETFFRFVKLLKPIEHELYNKEGESYTAAVTSNDLEELLLEKVQTLFVDTNLVLFPDKQITIIQDTIKEHYTFFKNCFVVSDKNGCKVLDYTELKTGSVWEDNVLNRNFEIPKETKVPVFQKFTYDISGNNYDLKKNAPTGADFELYKALLVSGGYMLHNYNDMERKALILTQGRISEDDSSEGREGKTLFTQIIGEEMLNRKKESSIFVKVQGKNMNMKDRNAWQDLEINTKLVLLDDPDKTFDFEDFYNIAEDSFKVRKLYEGNMYIKSRLVITTNRPINRDSGSSRARSCVIELASCFDSNYTPIDKYRHRFGRDWNEEEWNQFYFFVLNEMIPSYFKNNCKLVEPINKNLARNELLQAARNNTGSDQIIMWLDSLFTDGYFKRGITYSTSELLDKISNEIAYYKNHDKLNKTFTKMFKLYLTKSGFSFDEKRVSNGLKISNIAGSSLVVEPTQEELVFNNSSEHLSDVINEDDMPF